MICKYWNNTIYHASIQQAALQDIHLSSS